jgi:hypothetical protein
LTSFDWLHRCAGAHRFFSSLLRYRSHERNDGRDAHKPMKKKIMADVWPITAVPSLQMTVNLSSFAAASLATPGFSENREHPRDAAAVCCSPRASSGIFFCGGGGVTKD